MVKQDKIKVFIDKIYSKPPIKKYQTNKIVFNRIDEIWSIDLADMVDYKTSNNKKFRYIFVIFDNFSEFLWCIPLKNKNGQININEFSNILTTSKRKPLKIESDWGTEFLNNILQTFLKTKNIHHFAGFTEKGPSLVERVIRTIRNLLKKPIFQAGNADWLSELSAVVNKYNNTIHHSIKMAPYRASKEANERKVYSNLQDRRDKQLQNFNLGQLVRTADFKKLFSKGDSTNYSYKIYTITEVIQDTIPSYKINYLPERCNRNLLLPTKLTLEENNKDLKDLNLFQ